MSVRIYRIYHRGGAVLYESDTAEIVRDAVEKAVRVGADLRGADLGGANLLRVSLRGADLRGADLMGAYLVHARLMRADLRGANLAHTNLNRADLTDADLRDTVLDPSREPNGGEGEWQDAGDGYVYGYRTRNSPVVNWAHRYQDGERYEAPVFSTCPETACHPGLYVSPAPSEMAHPAEIIRVRLRRDDLHHAWGKHRCRAFIVEGAVEVPWATAR